MAGILVDHGVKTKLQKLFKVSGLTVKRALRGETRSLLAYKIRNTAIKDFGGRPEMTELPVTGCKLPINKSHMEEL